jgi:hypothetical protein
VLRYPFLTIAAVLLASCPGRAVDLKPETDTAFNRYVQLGEQRMQNDLQAGPFLWLDSLPAQQRQEVYERLKQGEVVTQKLETLDRGASLPVPGGLIHHWMGGVYVQLEAISLTRDIPDGLGWLVRPFITSIPRESLVFTLNRTRAALE